MPKILVADDNSNIQKMVGLALKDQGIDVVAVGNGEAAVRKISDVRPDLVLADVFMPVRNGYEVCKYVKNDSSLSHIPVILLVGAFDPLDEQEAQRVGADGVLKKPFVPPDPLISMVKSALVRSSAGTLNTPKPSGNSPNANATVPSLASNVPTVAASANQSIVEAEPLVQEAPPRPPELKIEPGNQPPVFGSLLGTPAAEEEETTFVSHAKSELADRDWSAADEEEEDEEEEDSSAAWRRDGGSEELADDTAASKEKAAKQKREPWTPTREKTQDLLDTADTPEFVSEAVSSARASKPSAPAGGLPASSPLPPSPVPAPVQTFVAPAKAEMPAEPQKPPVEIQPAPVNVGVGSSPLPAPIAETAPKEAEKSNAGNSWFSVSSSPWEADEKQANQAAPGWDAPSAPVSSHPIELPGLVTSAKEPALRRESAPSSTPDLEAEPTPTGFYTDTENLAELVSGAENISPITVETIRQEATQAIEESTLQQVRESSPEAAENAPVAVVSDVDALVAKVLARMNPEMLQAITREILKPVVEAMVQAEMKNKKS